MLSWLYQNKNEVLKKAQSNFLNSSSLILKIGCELEFFLLQKTLDPILDEEVVNTAITELKASLTNRFALIYDVEKERGSSQIEVKTAFTADIENLCQQLSQVKEFIINFADKKGLLASFAAQPFENDCGNALQFNISLHDESGRNILVSKDDIFHAAIANLLKYTDEMLILLAPNSEDYIRFDADLNIKLHKIGKYPAPINLSFGENNRTTAIRIPRAENPENTRIEYRIPCANSDPYLVIAAILTVIISKEKTDKILPTYGNAFDEKYSLKPFSKNYKTALNNFQNSKIILPLVERSRNHF